MSRALISIVLPVNHEGGAIAERLRQLERALAGQKHEIVVCHDLSSDPTLAVIAAMPDRPPGVFVVKNPLGSSAQATVRAGLAATQGDVVVTISMDPSLPLEAIPRMAEFVRAGADVVSGARQEPAGSGLARWSARASRLALRRIGGLRIHDPSSEFCAYSRRFLEQAEVSAHEVHEIALELAVQAHLQGALLAETPAPRSATQELALQRLPGYWDVLAPALWTALAFIGCLIGTCWWAAQAWDTRLAAMIVIALSFWCALVMGVTRWIRGRTTRWDALQPVLLISLPALLEPGIMGMLLCGCASAAVALASCGRSALRRRFADADAPGRPLFRQELLGLVVLALFVWLRHVELPASILGDDLDTSWSAALGHFLVSGTKAGSEWVFTAGPLAALGSPVFQPELFWWKLFLWEGFWRLCTVFCLVLAASRVKGVLERSLCFLILIVPEIHFDAYALTALVAAAVLLDDREDRKSAFVDSVALLALAGMALTNFTLLVAVVGMLGCLALARGLRRDRRAGLGFSAGALAALGAVWFLCGQGLTNIWPYLRDSWRIASACSEAQATPPVEPVWRVLGLWSVALLGVSITLTALAGGISRAKCAVALGLSFVVFCAWKTGFVRAADHAQFFFCFAAPSALLLPRPDTRSLLRSAGFVVLRLGVVSLACVGIARTDPFGQGIGSLYESMKKAPAQVDLVVQWFSAPRGMLRSLGAQTDAQRKACALPLIARRVGRESIDMLGLRQGLLLLGRFHWTPRPAFQSYVTCTPAIQQRNADFLAGPKAPRYLVARLETIDGRWRMSDDALALEIVNRRYAPLFTERGYLLLERRAQMRPEPQREVVLERELGFGEELQLPSPAPGCAQVLTLDLHYTLPGLLVRFLDSTPEMRMQLQRDDGVQLSSRIVPAMMRSRVLIDPLINSSDDWVRWMGGGKLPRCSALRVEAPAAAPWMLQPRFQVHLESVRDMQPPAESSFDFNAWMNGIFVPRPDEDSTPIVPNQVKLDQRDVAVVHAPSRLVWHLAPGRYRLTGYYGMLPNTWEQANIDGADFLVSWQTAQSSKQLLHREFRPTQPPSEREMQRLELEFSPHLQGDLTLATSPGPAGDSACDWCYWSEVRLEHLDGAAPVKKP